MTWPAELKYGVVLVPRYFSKAVDCGAILSGGMMLLGNGFFPKPLASPVAGS
jgi:hypothetical protein